MCMPIPNEEERRRRAAAVRQMIEVRNAQREAKRRGSSSDVAETESEKEAREPVIDPTEEQS
jgi:hypothetical protein